MDLGIAERLFGIGVQFEHANVVLRRSDVNPEQLGWPLRTTADLEDFERQRFGGSERIVDSQLDVACGGRQRCDRRELRTNRVLGFGDSVPQQ